MRRGRSGIWCVAKRIVMRRGEDGKGVVDVGVGALVRGSILLIDWEC